MKLTRTVLNEAVAKGVLAEEQGRALWDFLSQREQETPSFKAAHILYYLGGLIAIGAMTLFMTLGWERFGGGGLVLISSMYCAVALVATELLLRRRHLEIPAGIAATFAIVMVPLAVYGAQEYFGCWPPSIGKTLAYRDYHTHIDWRWLMMELSTLAAGALALWRYRLPFMVMPVAVTLWYMSMDLTPFLFGGDAGDILPNLLQLVSLCFGLVMIVLAFTVDIRSYKSKDFAFWLYLFGVLAFWGGLSSMRSDSELNKFLYCCVNLLMIALGAALSRRVFAVFGGIGVAYYLGHLSHTVFKDSMLFPVALTAIGVAVIGAGVLWQRHEGTIGDRLRSFLPGRVRVMLAQRAG